MILLALFYILLLFTPDKYWGWGGGRYWGGAWAVVLGGAVLEGSVMGGVVLREVVLVGAVLGGSVLAYFTSL